jgi:peptidoglycan/xylan/chitin deacetylase (PgdA/CDA1 family)
VLLAILALVASGCSSGLPPAVTAPASSPSPSAAAVPSAAPSPAPDVSTDPVAPAPSLPSFRPPVVPARAPVAAGFVIHVPVLMYHRIIPPAQAGDSLTSLVVPPTLFAAQMDALAAAGWHTITAARLLTDLASGIRPAPKTFVISFDDGYDDGYTYALPILKAHGFVATFYVITGRIGNAPGPLEALTPQHVQALAAAGMEIGNHTVNHVDLATASPITRRYQIVAASVRIQELVGAAPVTLAYPFGGWDAAAAADVQAAGIGIAFTTVEGAREAWATRYASPRVRVGPGTTPAMLLALVQRFSL